MKWDAIGERERRTVRAGAVVLLMAVAARGGIIPFLDRLHDANARLAREESLLVRDRELLRDARGARSVFDSLAAGFLASAPRLMPGGATVSIQAALSRRLEEGAAEASVQLTRVDPLAARAAGHGLAAVALRVEGESDFAGLLALLAELETDPRFLRVGELEVRARPASGEPGITVVSFGFVLTALVMDEPRPAPKQGARSALRRAP